MDSTDVTALRGRLEESARELERAGHEARRCGRGDLAERRAVLAGVVRALAARLAEAGLTTDDPYHAVAH